MTVRSERQLGNVVIASARCSGPPCIDTSLCRLNFAFDATLLLNTRDPQIRTNPTSLLRYSVSRKDAWDGKKPKTQAPNSPTLAMMMVVVEIAVDRSTTENLSANIAYLSVEATAHTSSGQAWQRPTSQRCPQWDPLHSICR